jgi:hypothetical protein
MENKCNSCFYALMDRDLEAPCITCTGYSNYVKGNVYMTSHASKPLKEAIDAWVAKGANGVTQEDFWYDTVNKPKHYMLFEEEGIEVRDVIEKLLGKLTKNSKGFTFSHQCASDYVQMMQYLMRFMDKNGVEDLKKARWYLDKLIQAYDDESDV